MSRYYESVLWKIERGESSIALEKLALLNETMDIDLNYLITGEIIPVLPINFRTSRFYKAVQHGTLINAVSLASSEGGVRENRPFAGDDEDHLAVPS